MINFVVLVDCFSKFNFIAAMIPAIHIRTYIRYMYIYKCLIISDNLSALTDQCDAYMIVLGLA